VTIAHFIPVSKQALDDSDFLASYIDSRLMYGLKLTEEAQLLNGTGITGYISGINTNSTAYAQADSPELYTDSLEYIRDMKRQAQASNYEPTVVVLNPKDWSDIELKRGTNEKQFIVGNPLGSPMGSPLWGMQVVVSNSQTAGTATVFDPQVFQIFDREMASVEMSYEDSTNFQKNMVTVRAEERLAFVCYSTSGCIKASI
jgi:HK97 family phage major capsid protein